MNDKAVYESKEVVDFYNDYNELQPPEKVIFKKIERLLPNCRMLDIGVGGGRTTQHLAQKVKTYIGIDYSAPMIDLCKKKFASLKNASFLTLDVRDLSQFEDNSFDFILFSFNGIDHFIYDERVSVLKEINRIGKNGSVFAFSTHNIQTVHSLFSINRHSGFIVLCKSILYCVRLIYYNGLSLLKRIETKQYARIIDGAHDFKLNLFYIKPSFQILQLEENGFDDSELYSLSKGDIIDTVLIDSATDSWITYLCFNRKS